MLKLACQFIGIEKDATTNQVFDVVNPIFINGIKNLTYINLDNYLNYDANINNYYYFLCSFNTNVVHMALTWNILNKTNLITYWLQKRKH